IEIGQSILSEEFLSLGEFTTRLLSHFGIRNLYPQALITAEAIVSWLGADVEKIAEGEIDLFRLKK
ncbi:MAG: hypothetical protein JRN15_23665, partial [Nitrososphaerota archaeon]|nr:hypothetical protein [Nitrososphaerota archaeon]